MSIDILKQFADKSSIFSLRPSTLCVPTLPRSAYGLHRPPPARVHLRFTKTTALFLAHTFLFTFCSINENGGFLKKQPKHNSYTTNVVKLHMNCVIGIKINLKQICNNLFDVKSFILSILVRTIRFWEVHHNLFV